MRHLTQGFIVWAAATFALAAAGCSDEAPTAQPPTPSVVRAAVQSAEVADDEEFTGQNAYSEGKSFVASGNMRGAVSAFERAVDEDPEFAEAWYQLGAARTRLAIQQVRNDEQAAMQLFREGVEAKKTAHALMSMGKFRVWDENQQAAAWNDLREALEDVDGVLADEHSLLVALHAMGG